MIKYASSYRKGSFKTLVNISRSQLQKQYKGLPASYYLQPNPLKKNINKN